MKNQKQYSKPYIVDKSDLILGDVLLCYTDSKKILNQKIGSLIRSTTYGDYTHAAICIDNETILEATTSGVQNTSVSDFVNDCKYIVVLRQPDAWQGEERKEALRKFSEKLIENKVKYNFKGVFNFKKYSGSSSC